MITPVLRRRARQSSPLGESAPIPTPPRGAGGVGAPRPFRVFLTATIGTAVASAAQVTALRLPVGLDQRVFFAHISKHWTPAGDGPWNFRVLHPAAVRTLSYLLPQTVAAVVVTSTLIGVAFWGIARLLAPYGRRTVRVGIAFTAVSPVVLASMTSPFITDSAVFATAAVTVVLVVERRWWPLCVVLPLGVACHELVLALAPFVLIEGWRDRRHFLRAVIAVSASVLVYEVVRRTPVVFGVVPHDSTPGLLTPRAWWYLLRFRIDRNGSLLLAIWWAVSMSAGFAWVFAPRGWRAAVSTVRTAGWLIPVSCVPLVLIMTDWERMLIPAVPAVIVLAAVGYDRVTP